MLPVDFLSVRVGPWRVMDRDFNDPRFLPHQLTDEFVIEFKTFGHDGRRGQDGPGEGLVAALVVGEMPSVQQIGDGHDELVPDVVREVRRTTLAEEFWLVENESRANDRIAGPVHDGL